MDEVAKTGQPIVITKHGRPVAQLAPIPAESRSLFGYMKDTVKIQGDSVAPIEEKWSALCGGEDQFYDRSPARPRSRRPGRKK